MNKRMWAPAVCLALGAAGVVFAAPQVEADPNQNYAVTPAVGPWMICAAYFTGPSAPDLARQMVLQVRGRYNTPAYVFNYADEERKREEAELQRRQPALPFDAPAPGGSDIVVPVPRRHVVIHMEEQCAVLIGGYPDENAAHAALLAVKQWPAPELKVQDGAPAFTWVAIDHGKEITLNPFASQSMVVRNPTVPHDSTAVDPKKDPFLKTLNADEEYSMLRCPGKYTLAVQEYLGAAMVQQQQAESSSFLKAIGLGGPARPGESLAVAADNAHKLADMLHQRGAEVYVLHTRTSSVVSIGSFNGLDDPKMKEMCERYAQWQNTLGRWQSDSVKSNPAGLFPSPVPIEVPRP